MLAIRKAGVTILLVEQRLAESLEIADRASILQTGRIILSGSAAAVRDNPDIRQAYLGMCPPPGGLPAAPADNPDRGA